MLALKNNFIVLSLFFMEFFKFLDSEKGKKNWKDLGVQGIMGNILVKCFHQKPSVQKYRQLLRFCFFFAGGG